MSTGTTPRPRRPISSSKLNMDNSSSNKNSGGNKPSTAQDRFQDGASSPPSRHWKLLANEAEFDNETIGPHVPMFRPRSQQDDDDESRELESGGSVRAHFWSDLRGDYGSVFLLLFLYTLQGIPLGLTASIPLILQNRHVSYAQQAVFSFAYWPFSLKLFWAPIVDAVYLNRLGRRKSWLVPTQYLIGVFMLILSNYVTTILGDDEDAAKPDVYFLTSIFFAFNFLAATQDIAVDGWALTMLSKRNIGYASTCNAVGQTAGYFLGNVVFLALESPEFCNKYLRGTPRNQGLVTLADFVYFWAWVFIIATTLVLIFKRESSGSSSRTSGSTPPIDDSDDIMERLGVCGTYKLLWDIIRLKPVLTLCFVHLTAKMAFAAADGITGLKLVELGVPKDKLAFIAIPLVPLQIILPWIIGRYTGGPRPMNVYLRAYPYRILLGVIFALVVYYTPTWKSEDGHFPALYYTMIVLIYCVHQVTVYSIFVAIMAFHAQISDPVVGGTYMTLMNTVSNMGGNWPVTLALSITDDLTWKECRSTNNDAWLGPCTGGAGGGGPNSSGGPMDGSEMSCAHSGGRCVTTIDGYYLLSAVCACIGLVWWRVMRRRVDRLHDVPKAQWSKYPIFKTPGATSRRRQNM